MSRTVPFVSGHVVGNVILPDTNWTLDNWICITPAGLLPYPHPIMLGRGPSPGLPDCSPSLNDLLYLLCWPPVLTRTNCLRLQHVSQYLTVSQSRAARKPSQELNNVSMLFAPSCSGMNKLEVRFVLMATTTLLLLILRSSQWGRGRGGGRRVEDGGGEGVGELRSSPASSMFASLI